MVEFFQQLFSVDGFMSRRFCGAGWSPQLIAFHTFSDFCIFVVYLLIPIFIFQIHQKDRHDYEKLVRYRRFLIYEFAAFICLCGITHLNNVLVFWYPLYRWYGICTFVTAIVSIATLLTLIWAIGVARRPRP